MMKINKVIQQKKAFVFTHWTRNAWSVFNSLKIVIHNLLNNRSSFKNSLLRQKNLFPVVCSMLNTSFSAENNHPLLCPAKALSTFFGMPTNKCLLPESHTQTETDKTHSIERPFISLSELLYEVYPERVFYFKTNNNERTDF